MQHTLAGLAANVGWANRLLVPLHTFTRETEFDHSERTVICHVEDLQSLDDVEAITLR